MSDLSLSDYVIDSVRGFTQLIRGRSGCTFAEVRKHCEFRGDDMSLWPDWAFEAQSYVTEAGAALCIFTIMTNAIAKEKANNGKEAESDAAGS